MKQQQKKYKQTLPANLPAAPEVARNYTPPRSPAEYRKISPPEMIGLALVATFVLSLFLWLGSVPASGSSAYYDRLIAGDPFHTAQAEPAAYNDGH